MVRTTVYEDIIRMLLEKTNYKCYFCHTKLKYKRHNYPPNPNRPAIHHLHYPARSFRDFVVCCYKCNSNERKDIKQRKRLYEKALKFYRKKHILKMRI